MIFGENSRRGSSSLIVVMVVAVVALAGMLVYVAIDRNVMTVNGYALPGSTFTIQTEETGAASDSEEGTIYGYSNGSYFVGYAGGDGITIYDVDVNSIFGGSIPSEYVSTSIGDVDVPGLGKTPGTTTTVDISEPGEGTMRFEYTSILHGLPFSFSLYYNNGISEDEATMKMTSSNIIVGDYDGTPQITQTFVSNSSTTVVIQAISTSVDGNYLYRMSKSDYSLYYVGDDNLIPAYRTTGSNTYSVSDATLTFSDSGITQIVWSGTYTPQNN